MLRAGWSGLFVPQSYGRGIMPLTFSALKSQRFRWCFGGMQILRLHWRSLLPGRRTPTNRLTIAQRMDYLISGLQWLNDLTYLFFTIAMAVIGTLLVTGHDVPVRPFVGPTVLLPAMLLASGLIRALWALRERQGISFRRAVLAFVNWLSLSLTVARACVEGLVRREGVFLRTPKSGGGHRLRAAFAAARSETVLALLLLALALALAGVGSASSFVVALSFWQGAVYASGPLMAWLNQRAHLTPELERRRQSEERRERLATVARRVGVASASGAVLAGVAFAVILALGALHPGHPADPFRIPQASSDPARSTPRKHSHTPGVATTPSSTTTSTTTTTTPSTSPPATTAPATTTTAPASTAPPPATTTPPPPPSSPTTTTAPPTTTG
jgi:hypothetical protein